MTLAPQTMPYFVEVYAQQRKKKPDGSFDKVESGWCVTGPDGERIGPICDTAAQAEELAECVNEAYYANTRPPQDAWVDGISFDEAKQAIKWAKSCVSGGYAAKSETNPKRKHMKILLKLAKAQFKVMKER